jgi:DNA-binding transcriptional MerR regulator
MTPAVTIGDFSRMTHLSVKTLRYYHRVGLLEPTDVNPATGFRYYTVEQIPTAQVIRRFRDLGMPVEQVRAVLTAPDVSTRNALVAAHLDALQTQLAQTEAAVASLRNLLEQPTTPIPIEHRTYPDTLAVAIRDTVTQHTLPAWWTTAFDDLHNILESQNVRPVGCDGGLYANELFENEAGDALVFVPVAQAPAELGRAEVVVIPAAELAVAIHHGAHNDVDLTYGALGAHVARHALGVEGAVREYYAVGRRDIADPDTWHTEIGWPIFQTADPAAT